MLETMEPMEAARAARVEAMAAEMRADIEGNGRKAKLYRVEVNIENGTQTQLYNHAIVKSIAGNIAHNIANDRRARVDFQDTEDTRQRISEYADACALVGYLPGMSGLCGYGFKCSRAWVSKFIRDNPRHPTTDLLNTTRELFADALLNSALLGATSAPASIFALKNVGGYSDRPEAEAETEAEIEPELTVEEIRKRLLFEEYGTDNPQYLPPEALDVFGDDELKAAGVERPQEAEGQEAQ